MPHFSWHGDTLHLQCHIQPNATADEVVGLHDGRLKIRLRAPANDGKANQGLIEFLAQLFSVPRSQIQIPRGRSSRRKTVSVVSPKTLPHSCLVQTE